MARTVAAFKVDYFQFLGPDGKLLDSQHVPALARDFNRLRELYKLMVLTRAFDKKAVALQRTGKLGTYASCLGHEAAHVGIGAAMKDEDCFAPMYREYGAQFYRGVRMSEVLLYWGGDERGNNFSGPKHDFPGACRSPPSACMPPARPWPSSSAASRACAVSVVGDGGTSKGDFYEAINAASAWKLPAGLVIVNNQWAISVPRSKQNTAATLAQKGIAGGLPSIQVDGNDLIACLWAMEKAVTAARDGKGAFVIEMMTYRLSDHTTADDARRYRPQEEVDEAWERDPVVRLRKYLIDQGAWDETQEEELSTEAVEFAQHAADEYLEIVENDPQPVTAMFDYMYKELPHDLVEQRAYAEEFPEDGGHH
jgi:2-oxoisovalerate dehydrogenase E1 component alpha subunit